MKVYLVVIIDDGRIAVEATSKFTDWEKFGCRVAGTVYDGVAGPKLIHNSAPDIVIIGIRMPGFNGLDAVKKTQGTREDIRFIIISGYSQFGYTQQATRYSISDHPLRPILTEEMGQTLKHVTDTLHKKETGTVPSHMDSLGRRIYGIRSGKDGYSSMISQAISYMDRNINRNTSLRNVYDGLLVSMSYFSKYSRKEIGIGFSSRVTMVKTENARILLKNPKNRINEVVHIPGYSDHMYFFQAFKKQSGYVPSNIKFNVKKKDKRDDPNARK